MDSRATIAGIGAITALGRGVEAQASSLESGSRSMHAPTLFDAMGGGPVAEVAGGLVPPLPPGHSWIDTRAVRLAVAALDEAVDDAGMDADSMRRASIWVGTTSSGILEGEVALMIGGDSPRPAYRHFDDQYVAGAVARAVSRLRGIRGARRTLSTACSSSANALARAAAAVEAGESDVAVVIGVDPIARTTYFGFGSLGLLSSRPTRPFDAGRDGLTLGEGAACLIVESRAHATARGARVRARVLGWHMNVDGHHITQPDPEGRGIEACMRGALDRSGLDPAGVDHVNAHGTGTPQNDLIEGQAIGRVFGRRVPVTSTKSFTGHPLGAAGALEAVFSVIAIRDGTIPATQGIERMDPALDIDVVTGRSRRVAVRTVMSNSFGFGGNNCCLVLGAPEAAR